MSKDSRIIVTEIYVQKNCLCCDNESMVEKIVHALCLQQIFETKGLLVTTTIKGFANVQQFENLIILSKLEGC